MGSLGELVERWGCAAAADREQLASRALRRFVAVHANPYEHRPWERLAIRRSLLEVLVEGPLAKEIARLEQSAIEAMVQQLAEELDPEQSSQRGDPGYWFDPEQWPLPESSSRNDLLVCVASLYACMTAQNHGLASGGMTVRQAAEKVVELRTTAVR